MERLRIARKAHGNALAASRDGSHTWRARTVLWRVLLRRSLADEAIGGETRLHADSPEARYTPAIVCRKPECPPP